MKKITCVLAILAAASTAAVAKDLKQEKKATAPAVAATEMTDAEMDNVTAGAWEGNSVSVDAAGLTQEVGGPYSANRFGYNGWNSNNDYRGARFLVPQ
jgi:hypothetical protein